MHYWPIVRSLFVHLRLNCQTVCKPGSVPSPSFLGRWGWPFIWDVRCRTPRATDPSGGAKARLARFDPCLPLLLGLAPGGVFPAAAIAGGAVRSYRTISPLPPMRSQAGSRGLGGVFSVALSLGSPPPAVNRHRVFVEPGLSSLPVAEKSGHPTVWHGMIWASLAELSKSPGARCSPLFSSATDDKLN